MVVDPSGAENFASATDATTTMLSDSQMRAVLADVVTQSAGLDDVLRIDLRNARDLAIMYARRPAYRQFLFNRNYRLALAIKILSSERLGIATNARSHVNVGGRGQNSDRNYVLVPRQIAARTSHVSTVAALYRSGQFRQALRLPYPEYAKEETITGANASGHFMDRFTERVEDASTQEGDAVRSQLLSVMSRPSIKIRVPNESVLRIAGNKHVWYSQPFVFEPFRPDGTAVAGFEDVEMFQVRGGRMLDGFTVPADQMNQFTTCFDASDGRHQNYYGGADQIHMDSWLGITHVRWEDDIMVVGPDGREVRQRTLSFPDPDMCYVNSAPLESHIALMLGNETRSMSEDLSRTMRGCLREWVRALFRIDAILQTAAPDRATTFTSAGELLQWMLTDDTFITRVSQGAVVWRDVTTAEMKVKGQNLEQRSRLLLRLAVSRFFVMDVICGNTTVRPSPTPRYPLVRLLRPIEYSDNVLRGCYGANSALLLAFKHFLSPWREKRGDDLFMLSELTDEVARDLSDRGSGHSPWQAIRALECPRMEVDPWNPGSTDVPWELQSRVAPVEQWYNTMMGRSSAPRIVADGGPEACIVTTAPESLDTAYRIAAAMAFAFSNVAGWTRFDTAKTRAEAAQGRVGQDFMSENFRWNPVSNGFYVITYKQEVSIVFPRDWKYWTREERVAFNLLDPRTMQYEVLSTTCFASSIVGDDYRYLLNRLPTRDAELVARRETYAARWNDPSRATITIYKG